MSRILSLRPLAALVPILLAQACANKKPQPAPEGLAPKVVEAAAANAVLQKPPTTSPPAEAPPTLKLPADTRPTHYALSLSIAPETEGFSGTSEIAIELDQARQVIWMHGRGLHVTLAQAQLENGESLLGKFEQLTPDGMASLTLPRAIGPGKATLRFAWDAGWDQQLAGLYRAKEGGREYAFTQFEAIDARRAFPGFDEPIFKTPYDVILTVPQDDVAVANTLPVEEQKMNGGQKRIRFATTLPLPTYLIAFQVGPFDVVQQDLAPNQVRKRTLPVRGIAAKGRGKELKVALDFANALLPLLERYFGSEYPYDKLDHIAVPDYTYGAMENVGAITYREQLLLFQEGKTPEDSRSEIANVVAHEMAHQWFGDLVTLRWWNDAWLNEAFATWMSYRVQEELRPDMQAQITALKSASWTMGTDALVSARAIRQPVERTEEIWNAFDGITYQKGAAVLNMFERFAGPEKFRMGIREYIDSHRFGGGSTDELLASLSKAAGKDVATPFRTFIEQAGVPLVQAKVECKPGGAQLHLQQERYFPLGSPASDKDRAALWQIPICARYGLGEEIKEACTLLDAREGALALEGCPSWVIPNADASGYYRWSLAPKDVADLGTVGYAKLGERERISFAESVRAAMSSGALPMKDGLAALETFAKDPSGSVATEPFGPITHARVNVVPEALRPQVEAYARKLYQPAYRRLGWKPRPGENRFARAFRTAVIEQLVETGQDKAVQREAARRGVAFAGLPGKQFHPEAVDPDLAPVALSVAVRQGGAPFFDALVARLGTLEDADLRDVALTALSSVVDPALSAKALALSFDPRLRQNERAGLIFNQLGQLETREAALQWLEKNFDALAKVLPEQYASGLTQAGGNFCDRKHLNEIAAFFGPKAEKSPGGTRGFRQSQERIKLCIAQADAQRDSAAAFFGKGATGGARPSAVH